MPTLTSRRHTYLHGPIVGTTDLAYIFAHLKVELWPFLLKETRLHPPQGFPQI